MPTAEPHPHFSSSEKRLVILLSRLIDESKVIVDEGRNQPVDCYLLLTREAKEILDEVQEFASSRSFLEGAQFSEAVLQGNFSDRAREIFLSGRTRNGKTRTMASKQWDEFQRRMGSEGSPYYRKPIQPMSFSFFKKMERKLLQKSGVSAAIVDLIMDEIDQKEVEIELIRLKQRSIRYGIVRHAIDGVIASLISMIPLTDVRSLSINQIIGAITLITNSSVMFTTRDWSVAGTLSTMAGALVATAQKEG